MVDPRLIGTAASRRLAVAVAGLALSALLGSCTDASLEPKPVEGSNADSQVVITGTVCAPAPDRTGFPVKVVIVVDQSGSMCVSDPPGSQESSGFCEQLPANIIPPGVTEPARVRALKKLVEQFAPLPNVELAIVPFETNVKNVWPQVVSGARFGPANDPSLVPYIGGLQAQLGKGTDYQGAMSYAYGLIASDIEAVAANNPQQLPRTRYVMVFLTDGTPYPRCSANDNLAAYADQNNPQLTWADSSSAVDFCNILDPASPDLINEFDVGTDRNQNYQIFAYIQRLMELKDKYNVGDLRVHTVLLFNEEAVRLCGPICQDIYGTYPGVAPADFPAAAHQIARWTLQQVAQLGNGVYQEFIDGDIQSLGLGALDYSSLSSKNVLKKLILQNVRMVPHDGKRAVDSDGDGIPDTIDNRFELGTSPYDTDSDDDCFSDRFEFLHQNQGFRPANDPDLRGCDATFADNDTDGDGLFSKEEPLLGSRPTIVDSDADGIPDGLEARFGLNTVLGNANSIDTDGDLISDADEYLADTDPTTPDADLYDREAYKYEVVALPRGDDDPTCYDFSISNVRMITPPQHNGETTGLNVFKIWFGAAPESGVTSDYGEWQVGCAAARYAPPSNRDPLGPELHLEPGDFGPPDAFSPLELNLDRCVNFDSANCYGGTVCP